MKRALLIAAGLAAASAAGVQAQLTNFPVEALPSAGEAPATFFGGMFGRGLNAASGKQNAFGVFAGRSGIGGRLSAAVGAGMVNYDPDAKYTFGVAGGVDMLPPGGTTQVAVNVGIGYISLATDVSLMSFPIGVALKGQMAAGSGTFTPWVMPRVHMTRASVLSLSETFTDFGVSGGAGFTSAGGFGIHATLDLLAADVDNIMTLGVGVHYMMP